MTYYKLYLFFLKKYNPEDDPNLNADFYKLLFHYSKDVKNIADFFMYKRKNINLKVSDDFFLMKLKNLCKHKVPVALITQNTNFYGLDFFLSKGVLIPRSETELLADTIIMQNYQTNLRILDLCSGIGTLGLTLAKNLKAKTTLVEKFELPYLLSLKNKQRFHLGKRVKIKHMDVKRFLITNKKKFDILVMNPPYINLDDKNVESNVKKYEPSNALFAKKRGLYFYELVLNYLPYLFDKKIKVYFEIGKDQKNELKDILNNIWWKNIFNIRINFLYDYHNIYRFLCLEVEEKFDEDLYN